MRGSLVSALSTGAMASAIAVGAVAAVSWAIAPDPVKTAKAPSLTFVMVRPITLSTPWPLRLQSRSGSITTPSFSSVTAALRIGLFIMLTKIQA